MDEDSEVERYCSLVVDDTNANSLEHDTHSV